MIIINWNVINDMVSRLPDHVYMKRMTLDDKTLKDKDKDI